MELDLDEFDVEFISLKRKREEEEDEEEILIMPQQQRAVLVVLRAVHSVESERKMRGSTWGQNMWS